MSNEIEASLPEGNFAPTQPTNDLPIFTEYPDLKKVVAIVIEECNQHSNSGVTLEELRSSEIRGDIVFARRITSYALCTVLGLKRKCAMHVLNKSDPSIYNYNQTIKHLLKAGAMFTRVNEIIESIRQCIASEVNESALMQLRDVLSPGKKPRSIAGPTAAKVGEKVAELRPSERRRKFIEEFRRAYERGQEYLDERKKGGTHRPFNNGLPVFKRPGF